MNEIKFIEDLNIGALPGVAPCIILHIIMSYTQSPRKVNHYSDLASSLRF